MSRRWVGGLVRAFGAGVPALIPEEFGVFRRDAAGVEVAASQEGEGAVPHLELELGQVAEVGGVVGGEGVPQGVGLPGGEAGGEAEIFPLFAPMLGDAHGGGRLQGEFPMKAQGDEAAAARFAGLGADVDGALLPVDVARGVEALHLGGANAAVEHEVKGQPHGAVLFEGGGAFEASDLGEIQGNDFFFDDGRRLDAGDGVGIAPLAAQGEGEDAVEDGSGFAEGAWAVGEEAFEEVSALAGGEGADGASGPVGGVDELVGVVSDVAEGDGATVGFGGEVLEDGVTEGDGGEALLEAEGAEAQDLPHGGEEVGARGLREVEEFATFQGEASGIGAVDGEGSE